MKYWKPICFWLGLAMFVSLLVINPQYRVTISQQQVQAALDQRLPVSPPTRYGVSVTVEPGMTVAFMPGGDVKVTGPFVVKPGFTRTTRYEGQLTAHGDIVYEQRAFYLRNLQLDSLTGTLVASERAQAAERLVQRLGTRVLGKLDVEPDDLKAVIDQPAWRQTLRDHVAARVGQTPIYRLDGRKWWHWVVGSSLENLTVSDQQLVATLSFDRLVVSLVLGALAVVLALAMGLAFLNSGRAGVLALVGFSLLAD